MKRVKKTLYLSLCGLLIAGIVTGTEAAEKKSSVKIAQITDFTSPSIAIYSVKMRSAVQMALEEINAKGGVLGRNLELTFVDGKSDSTLSISHARRLKEQGIIAIIGGSTSTEALALGKWSQDEGHIPLIQSYAASDALNGHPWVFRSFNDTQMAQLSLLVMQKLKKTKVGIFYTTLAWGKDASAKVEKHAPEFGVQIVGKEALEFKATDATVQAMKLRDSGAEGVICCDYAIGISTFAQALNTIGWHPPITSSWGNVYSALTVASPPTILDGAIPQSICDRENPRVMKVLESYAKYTKKERDIDDPILLGYSCVLELVHAIKQAKTADDPAAIRDALYEVKMKDLPLGRKDSVLSFTRTRNWLVPIEDHSFMIIKNGRLEPYKLK